MATITMFWDAAREVVGESAEVPYLVLGAADEAAVRSALQAGARATYGGQVLDKIQIDDRLSETQWRGTVKYRGLYTPPDVSYDFDTSGGTMHITQNLATVGRYGAKASVNEKGGIGWDGHSLQGADVIVPKFEWGETHYLFWTPMNAEWAYKKVLMDLTGKVNNGEFRGFAAGEVLFMGARGRRTPETTPYWGIDYRFAASPNLTGQTVGDITGIAKKGWELMDVRYVEKSDDEFEITIPVPVAVLIHKVYELRDFSLLTIGTGI